MWQYGISVEISVRMIKPKCPQWKVWKRGNNNENCGDEDCRGTGSRTASQTEPWATRHHDHLPLTVGLDHIHVLWLEDVWLTGTTALLSFVNICETHGGLSKNLSLYEPLHFLNYKYTRHAILTHILTLYIFFLHPHAYKLCNTEVIYFASRVFLTLHYTDCKMEQFHSFFLHFAAFKLFSLFENNVPQNQCYQWNVPIMTLASWDHFWVKLTCKRYVKGCLKVQDVQKNWL